MRHSLVGKQKRKRGGIIYKSASIAQMVDEFDAQYSSDDTDDSGPEKARKVNNIVKTNIKLETAEDKIETMLAMNMIKVTDVNWQKRKKDEKRRSILGGAPVAGRHVKNSASQPTLATNIAFIAATPTGSEKKKADILFAKELEGGTAADKRKPAANLTPITKAVAAKQRKMQENRKFQVLGKTRPSSKHKLPEEVPSYRPDAAGTLSFQASAKGAR